MNPRLPQRVKLQGAILMNKQYITSIENLIKVHYSYYSDILYIGEILANQWATLKDLGLSVYDLKDGCHASGNFHEFDDKIRGLQLIDRVKKVTQSTIEFCLSQEFMGFEILSLLLADSFIIENMVRHDSRDHCRDASTVISAAIQKCEETKKFESLAYYTRAKLRRYLANYGGALRDLENAEEFDLGDFSNRIAIESAWLALNCGKGNAARHVNIVHEHCLPLQRFEIKAIEGYMCGVAATVYENLN